MPTPFFWGSRRAGVHLGHGLAHETAYVLTQIDQNTVKSYLQTGRPIRSSSFIVSIRPQIASALQALLDTLSRSGG